MRIITTPPTLPPFLADKFDLKPVEGVPSDEEVKMVHAVIRTNTTNTPPSLPTHIPVELEAVTGSPSDKQIQSAQAALRISESLSNVPSMFDTDLNMKLSQHLFNIQFERYLRRAADGDGMAKAADSVDVRSDTSSVVVSNPDLNESSPPQIQEDRHTGTDTKNHDDGTSETGSAPSTDAASAPEAPPPKNFFSTSFAFPSSTTLLANATQRTNIEVKSGFEETNRLLAELSDRLKNWTQFLIGEKQLTSRINNYRTYVSSLSTYPHDEIIGPKGDTPMVAGLPALPKLKSNTFDSSDSKALAQYLRLYEIGHELIQEGDELTVAQDKLPEAVELLRRFLCV
ncbi:hypothetical protein FRC07_003256 [Ceratobasidium sp. 392]|nr:hypothetical protein FRC07_003256 [Ceratobasidium sp. 392]